MARYKNTKIKYKLPFWTNPRNCDTIEQCERGIEELEGVKALYEKKKVELPDTYSTRWLNLRKKLIKLQSKAGYHWLLYVYDEYTETYCCWGVFKDHSTAQSYEKFFKTKRTCVFLDKIKLNSPELLPRQNKIGRIFIISLDGGITFNLNWCAVGNYNSLQLAVHLLKKNVYDEGVETVEIIKEKKEKITRDNVGKEVYHIKDSLNNTHTIVMKSLPEWNTLPEIVFGSNHWKPEIQDQEDYQ